MDAIIYYKYKDGLHEDEKSGYVQMQRGVYKYYTGSYNTQHDAPITQLERRLWHCHLVALGDHQCRGFLKDIAEYMQTEENRHSHVYDEKFKKVYEFLLKQHEIVEVIYTME